MERTNGLKESEECLVVGFCMFIREKTIVAASDNCLFTSAR